MKGASKVKDLKKFMDLDLEVFNSTEEADRKEMEVGCSHFSRYPPRFSHFPSRDMDHSLPAEALFLALSLTFPHFLRAGGHTEQEEVGRDLAPGDDDERALQSGA